MVLLIETQRSIIKRRHSWEQSFVWSCKPLCFLKYIWIITWVFLFSITGVSHLNDWRYFRKSLCTISLAKNRCLYFVYLFLMLGFQKYMESLFKYIAVKYDLLREKNNINKGMWLYSESKFLFFYRKNILNF